MKRKIFAAIFIILMVIAGFLFFRYIFYYNSGNRDFERMDYVGAIEEYENALASNPTHGKECSIRINLALAMIYNLGEDFAEPENVENSIEVLLAAKDVLLEEECATLEGDGHSETAEQLKREIDELIEQLQQEASSKPSEDEEEETESPQGTIDEETEQEIMEQLQQTQSSATQERQENIQESEIRQEGANFDFDISIW